MKIEFLIADIDGTWCTEIKNVPDRADAVEWAYDNINEFSGDIALIAVYNGDPEDDEEMW